MSPDFKGSVDLNTAIISRVPSCDLRHILGKEKLVQVRGRKPRAASSQWVRRCLWTKYICEEWVFCEGEMTITHPTVSLGKLADGVCILSTNG
jgi:hypothetical protein